ncbi:TPA: cell-envelope stress modulator CpxP, partial [Klebsiella pneumoniae]|nr:cell-envelope stress modulator CpxP [Klebsiella pneumoniae]
HQQRMDQLREVARMQKGSAMMLSSSSNTLQPQ